MNKDPLLVRIVMFVMENLPAIATAGAIILGSLYYFLS